MTLKRTPNLKAGGDRLLFAVFETEGIPPCVTEYRFHPTRKWQFDYAWPWLKVALEKEGGVFTRQAHGSITGIKRDIEKYNAAAMLGWLIIRQVPRKMYTRETIEMVRTTLLTSRTVRVLAH